MIAVTTSKSAITRALCRNIRLLGLIAIGSIALACSLESTLDSLASQFPKHKYELNKLVSVSQVLHAEIGLNVYTPVCDSPPCVIVGGKEEKISLEEARKRFSKSSDQLTELGRLSKKLELDYFSYQDDEFLVITMEGGGVLGGDSGYLFSLKGSPPYRAAKHSKPISGEDGWYAFVG